MAPSTYSDREAAAALVSVLGSSKWSAVALAAGFLLHLRHESDEAAARVIFDSGSMTLARSRELVSKFKTQGFLALLEDRRRVGSAENPITKLFPAAITEERFLELLDDLRARRPAVDYIDDRQAGHSLTDFTLREGGLELPINIKNAGTRFERAEDLVRLDPNDCVPIPSYKAHAAIEALPNLLYVVSVDYDLVPRLASTLPGLLSRNEQIAWDILNRSAGAHLHSAEDIFVAATVRAYWEQLKALASDTPFHVISARKAVRVLQTKPYRTPGIGLRAWGTGASAEVNVHVSIREDMTPWASVRERIIGKGIGDIVEAVNRRRTELVYDPEI